MTRYIQSYDEYYDESFQIEVSEEEFSRLNGVDLSLVSMVPWPNVPIKSRYRSERHPEFYQNEEAEA